MTSQVRARFYFCVLLTLIATSLLTHAQVTVFATGADLRDSGREVAGVGPGVGHLVTLSYGRDQSSQATLGYVEKTVGSKLDSSWIVKSGQQFHGV